MKASVLTVGFMWIAGLCLAGSNNIASAAEKTLPAVAAHLPASLDNFYPPKNPAPAYLLAMLDLARPFSGMVADVMEGDMPNAQANYEAFKKLYVQTSAMIPEWKEAFPLEAVDQLGTALAGGDPGQIMPAVEAVGGTCHNCHLKSMAPVHQKYRWNDFGEIVVTDPLSGQDVKFAQLMMMMETNFTGIGNDLQQDQPEAAQKHFDGFNARFKAVSEACMICHDTDRHYFVSKDVTDMIAGLQAELNQPQADMGKIGGLLASIGNESCSKCHLVHVPAAYGQYALRAH